MFTKRTKLTAALVAAALFFLVAWTLLRSKPVTVAYPNPNGYDELLIAANLAAPVFSEDLRGVFDSLDDLRKLQTNNARAIQIARAALPLPSRVRYTDQMILSGTHLQHIAKLKSLAFSFAVEARIAELEGDPDRAAQGYIEFIRAAHQSSRGGLLAHRLMALSLERIALHHLGPLNAKLTSPEKVADALEEIRRNEESIQDTIQNERAWASRAGGWQRFVLRMAKPNMLNGAETNFEKKALELQGARDQLIKDLRANRPTPTPARDPSAP